MEAAPELFVIFSFRFLILYSVSSLALCSESTTAKGSPGAGAPSIPITTTGEEGLASFN